MKNGGARVREAGERPRDPGRRIDLQELHRLAGMADEHTRPPGAEVSPHEEDLARPRWDLDGGPDPRLA
ncbi:MAG: hypothetical protein AAGH15_10460 [Myxococcota bacterium]